MIGDTELRGARDEFRALLESDTVEHDWQRFFTEKPFVLSRSLPVRMTTTSLTPLGRPGRSEPDFVFYPTARDPLPHYGVIELKRPSTAILTRTRKTVAILSRDAETAVSQALEYSRRIRDFVEVAESADRPLFVGNRQHNFVILGTSKRVAELLGTELYLEQIVDRLPPGLDLIPYDSLLALFESELNLPFYVLAVDLEGAARSMKEQITETWKAIYAILTRYGQRHASAIRRSAHGYRPEWPLRTWLPEEFSNVDVLRESISQELPDWTVERLERLDAALRAALPLAVEFERRGES